MKISNWYGFFMVLSGLTAMLGEALTLNEIHGYEPARDSFVLFAIGMIGVISILTYRLYKHVRYFKKHNIETLE